MKITRMFAALLSRPHFLDWLSPENRLLWTKMETLSEAKLIADDATSYFSVGGGFYMGGVKKISTDLQHRQCAERTRKGKIT